MVVGCGIDTEEKYRFTKHIKSFKKSDFLKLVFSQKELDNFYKYGLSLCVPIAFCCKEAVFKALGDSWTTSPMTWKDISITFNSEPLNKEYHISLHNQAKETYELLGSPKILSDYSCYEDHVTFEIILHN